MTEIKDILGLVYNIQRYSIHDGPGIRTTVFLKGCPLRCLWCQNPESITGFTEVGYSESKCAKDYACVKSCFKNAIKITKKTHTVQINRKLCKTCDEHNCIDTCINKALRLIGENISIERIIKEVEREVLFYRNSEGGITLSGGEPLYQPVFTLNLLKSCKERGLHTVLETCGYADWDIFREILKYVDIVLYDIKCIDSRDHIRFTGVSNKKILQNLRLVPIETETSIIVRIPIIPGYNDSEENIIATSKFLKDAGINMVNLLPYHKMGIGKYKIVGKRYRLKKIDAPEEEHLNDLKELIKSYGLQCDVY